MSRRVALPLAIFAISALVYALTLGSRAFHPTPDNHFVHLAQSLLHGQLGVVGNHPPGTNDWALYDGTWYVSFPPFPAAVILPAVALWGTGTWDALFWAIFAGIAPALVFVVLETLRERGQSPRTTGDNLWLTGLFAFGTVFYFTSVQGTVWFAAHVVASTLIALFVLASLDAKHPLLAGCCIGLLFLTRPPTLLLSLFFLVEALSAAQTPVIVAEPGDMHPAVRVLHFVRQADLKRVLRSVLLFSVPVALIGGLQLWMNAARFDDPMVFGHEYLQIKWRTRIDEWGLFSFHYFSKNLAIFTSSLPWLSPDEPRLLISRHGLALWFTTPALLWLGWPRAWNARMVGLACAAALVALQDLSYQNSGWIQFGYRFALDYMPLLFVLLALGGRKFGPVFALATAMSVAVNLFGAVTFDRAHRYYDNDNSQNRVFQPD